jgi:hypothetical protein
MSADGALSVLQSMVVMNEYFSGTRQPTLRLTPAGSSRALEKKVEDAVSEIIGCGVRCSLCWLEYSLMYGGLCPSCLANQRRKNEVLDAAKRIAADCGLVLLRAALELPRSGPH